jgi:c-di-GMP-binding flagellar brake protein YcgR
MLQPMAEAESADPNAVWSRILRDREAIWRVFRDFHDRGDQVALRFESVNAVYTARILEVDHRRVTLEGVHPRSGEVLLNAGRAFTLSGRSEGAYIYSSRNRCAGSTESESGSRFAVDLPDELLLHQRRRGPRFTLPASLRGGRARIALTCDGQILSGSIEDLSAGGCRATFDPGSLDMLSRQTFDGARLDVAGLLSVRMRAVMRHQVTDAKTGTITCGFEFVRMSALEQTRLEQFVRNLAKRAGNV